MLQSGNSIHIGILCETHENIGKITSLADEILFFSSQTLQEYFSLNKNKWMVIQHDPGALTTEQIYNCNTS